MVGNVGARVEPVANPSLRPAKRERLVAMAKAKLAYNIGPVRQTRNREEVVSPLALERECGTLLYRTQRAIATVVTSQVYQRELRGTIQERALRQHEWDIAVAPRHPGGGSPGAARVKVVRRPRSGAGSPGPDGNRSPRLGV